MRPTTIVDTETTSLIDPHLPEGRRTWDLAMVQIAPLTGAVLGAAWYQFTDVDLTHANEESLRIGDFAERYSGDYGDLGALGELPGRDYRPTPLWGCQEAAAIDTIRRLTDGAIIAGSNPAFDMANLADLLRRHRAEPGWYHHPRDIPNVAHGWLSAQRPLRWTEGSYSTRVLSEACGVPEPTDRHTAWGDVVWMLDLDDVVSGRRKPALSATVAG